MEQINESKGCVYFFRHIGLTPVKIGYSTNESPIDRFNHFSTYAPYGSEIIGFIQTYDAKNLETTLHKKYVSKRLMGEWFDITESECNDIISFYSNIEDIKKRNEFQIAWAKKIVEENKIIETITEQVIATKNIDLFSFETQNTIRDRVIYLLKIYPRLPIKEVAYKSGCSLKTVYQYKKHIIKNM